jgi:uncharacterized protein (DUF362 family)
MPFTLIPTPATPNRRALFPRLVSKMTSFSLFALLPWIPLLHPHYSHAADAPPPAPKSRIAMVEDPSLLTNFDPDPTAVKNAVASLLSTLTGKSNAADAWKELGINPNDTVAIKINARGDPRTCTRREVIDAVTATLIAAGVSPDHITIYEKREVDMIRSGYPTKQESGKVQVRAVIASAASDIPGLGFDPAATPFFSPTMGELIYGDLKFQSSLIDGIPAPSSSGSASDDRIPFCSYFTKLITPKETKIINLGTMTSDPDLGIYGCCASLAIGSVDNSRRLFKPNADQDTTIGDILTNDLLKPKTVLHISDGLILKFAGGKDFDANYATTPGLLLASTDPVALDSIALARFEKMRANPGIGIPPIPKIGNVPHIAGAALVGAGTTDSKQMEILKVK